MNFSRSLGWIVINKYFLIAYILFCVVFDVGITLYFNQPALESNQIFAFLMERGDKFLIFQYVVQYTVFEITLIFLINNLVDRILSYDVRVPKFLIIINRVLGNAIVLSLPTLHIIGGLSWVLWYYKII